MERIAQHISQIRHKCQEACAQCSVQLCAVHNTIKILEKLELQVVAGIWKPDQGKNLGKIRIPFFAADITHAAMEMMYVDTLENSHFVGKGSRTRRLDDGSRQTLVI